MKNVTAPKIRELMPPGFLTTLSELTGSKNLSNLSQVVRLEHTASKFWPSIEQLARDNNPTGFAQWEAAHAAAA